LAGGGPQASFRVAAAGFMLAALYCAGISPWLGGLATLVIGLGAFAAPAIGIHRHRPAQPGPWLALLAAAVGFLIGIVVRPWSVEQTGAAAFAGDVFTMSGYAFLAVGLSLFLRGRQAVRHAITDGVIVSVGAALLAVEFLALPAMRIGSRPDTVSVLAGLYPIWDVVVLLLVLNLGFSTAGRLVAFRFLAASMVWLFVGDIGYAWIGAQGRLTGSELLDLPYLIGFTCLAAAALHPSMRDLAGAGPRPVQAWSLGRLSLIVPALATPLIVMARGRPPHTVDQVVLVAGTAVLMTALLARAVSAVRSLSDIQRDLQHQARHDHLTGLPNRALLLSEVAAMLPGRGTWVLFIDLDGFKYVNDHWGHEAGDLLLIQVGRRLSEMTTPGSVVARMAGDEFVIAGRGTLPEADALAERVLSELARPVDLAGVELIVTGSIGVAVARDQPDAESLLRDADLAMYRAKAEGRNRRKLFDADMRQTVRDRVELEMDLRHALARHELWVAFQPIVNCRTGEVVAAEALVRWSHPTRGTVAPNDFIGVAEETGLIEDIGEFVLRESLRQLGRWRDEGILPDRFYVSVNASARQLRDHRLRQVISEVLAKEKLGAERLVLEMTESIMMGDTNPVMDVLSGLRRIGVRLSVDDFGTGYSSLSYLNRFPVSMVKIDRAFVRGLGVRPDEEAIVRAVIAMASALRLEVVAEGVETEAQRRVLDALGVRLAQGWLWGRAEAGASFADLHLMVKAQAEYS
jgi:diguanylate cyclase (GGDEF)-like protein